MKDPHSSNGYEMDADMPDGTKQEDQSFNMQKIDSAVGMNDAPKSKQDEITVAPEDNIKGSLLRDDHNQINGRESEADISASSINDENKLRNVPEDESNFIALPSVITSKPFESEDNGKRGIEGEVPKLVLCYKESNPHVVKDICVDEGVPAVDKLVTESWKENYSMSDETSDEEETATMLEQIVDVKMPMLNVSEPSSEEDTEDHYIHEYKASKNIDIDSSLPDNAKSSSGVNAFVDKDDDSEQSLDDLTKILGPRHDETGKMGDKASEKQFVADHFLLQELKSHNSYNPFLDPTFDENDLTQQSYQMSLERIDESPSAASTAEEPNPDSKLEGGAVSFFDSTKLYQTASSMDKIPHNSSELHQSDDVLTRTDENSYDVSDVCQNESPNKSHESVDSENAPDQEEENSGNLSATSPDNTAEKVLERSNKPEGATNILPDDSKAQYGEGETSFSAAGTVSSRITYSGPIPYSGSISLRSDSSTTSARSFAFPVLQSEWNSSPVRMAKADRRHTRKHKGWRHGLLCCKF